MALKVWKEVLLDPLHHHLVAALLEEIHRWGKMKRGRGEGEGRGGGRGGRERRVERGRGEERGEGVKEGGGWRRKGLLELHLFGLQVIGHFFYASRERDGENADLSMVRDVIGSFSK